MASSARHLPPPLNLPFKYRRKSYSSEFEDRPSSGTSSSSSFSFPASTPRWTYASTSASSSPIASEASPPPSTYSSSPTRPVAHAHSYSNSAHDTVRIRKHPSPSHTGHHPRAVDDDQDFQLAWRNERALLDVDKPYSSSNLSTLYTTAHGTRYRYSRYAYGYAMASRGTSASFAMSSDSEELPATSDFDLPPRSTYDDDMDVDADSESSPDVDAADDLELDMFSPPRRRISFSMSAERDVPYVRPVPPSPFSTNKKAAKSKTSESSSPGPSHSPTMISSSVSPPALSSSDSSASPSLAPVTMLSDTSSQLPTPPASSPEDETPPLSRTRHSPSLPSPALSHAATVANDSPPHERKTRSRPTLMDLLSPSPSRPPLVRNMQEREDSPFLALWGKEKLETSPLPGSSPIKEASPLPGSSPLKESSPLPDSSPFKDSSPLPDSSPTKDPSSLPPSPALDEDVVLPSEEASSLITPTSPVVPLLPLPPSTESSDAPSPSSPSGPASPLARTAVFTPSPSQMPLTPPSPALLPSSSPLSSVSPLSTKDRIIDDNEEGDDAKLDVPNGLVTMKEISPLRLDEDEDIEIDPISVEPPSVTLDVDDELDELANDGDGMKTVIGTPMRGRTPSRAVPFVVKARLSQSKSREGSPLASKPTHSPSVPADCADGEGRVEEPMLVEQKREDRDQAVASVSTCSPRPIAFPAQSAAAAASLFPRTPSPAAMHAFTPPVVVQHSPSPQPQSRVPLSPSLSPPPVSLRATPSLAIKREEIPLSSPLSSPPSPLSTSHDPRSDSEEEEERRPASKKRRVLKHKEGDEPRRKRSRVDAEESEGEAGGSEHAGDSVRPKARSKSVKPRGRKSKVKSVAPAEEEEGTEANDGAGPSDSSKAASSTKPRHPAKKRGRKKRQRSLSSSPETHSRTRANWDEESPMPLPEIEGMIIETLATARATSLSAAAIFASLMSSRPALKTMPRRLPPSASEPTASDGASPEPLPLHKSEWLLLITTILTTGHLTTGVFGKVDSSASDSDSPTSPSSSPMHLSHKAALLSQWFYVPERDRDRERANLVRTMMRGPGKRSETMKYKQYYWKPLGKISRWDPEDDL